MPSALIIEADLAARRVLQIILGRQGWQVTAVDAVDFERALIGPVAELVYINESIGDDCGYRLLFALRADRRWRRARIVMAGVGDSGRSALCARELGADGFLSLPISTAQARAKLLPHASEETRRPRARGVFFASAPAS
ncbi:MAG TPA: hypothetical protein VGE76_12300 [Opitutaceae bacterium]